MRSGTIQPYGDAPRVTSVVEKSAGTTPISRRPATTSVPTIIPRPGERDGWDVDLDLRRHHEVARQAHGRAQCEHDSQHGQLRTARIQHEHQPDERHRHADEGDGRGAYTSRRPQPEHDEERGGHLKQQSDGHRQVLDREEVQQLDARHRHHTVRDDGPPSPDRFSSIVRAG